MTRLLITLLVAFALGCGEASNGPANAGDIDSDAGALPDAGDPADAGESDAGSDADGGHEDDADGGETADAGDEPDGGEVPDAGPTFGPDIFWNGGFELWDDPLPARWFGEESNISEDSVQKVTENVFHGSNACALVNPSDKHKRFTTSAMSLRAGRYHCRYHVRGHGEVRTARYETKFSSYTSWETINSDEWKEMTYRFTVLEDVFDTFEFVFSVRNTDADRGHIVIDEVSCQREDEPCDQVECESWAQCVNATATCEPRFGRCADSDDCREWEQCNDDHRCEPREGRCNATTECAVRSPATPVCDRDAHTCVEGDPCAEVTCASPRTCDPASATCVLPEGSCITTADCTGALPACDPQTKTCVGADHPANIFPNGGFESWNVYYVPYRGEHLLPDGWYGMDGFYDTEIDPKDVREYTAHVHGGSKAVQLLGGQVADRFTSEAFNIPPGAHTCSYRVRGKGTLRHRYWSRAGLSPWTDFLEVDSDAWQVVTFSLAGNMRDFRLVLYPSRTDAARDHLQVDDVVCTKN